MHEQEELAKLLQRMLDGELLPSDPAYLAACRRYPEIPGRLEALRAVEGQMQTAAEEERGLLEEALGMDPLPGEARFAKRLEAEFPSDLGPARGAGWGRPKWFLVVAAVAAAALVAVLWLPEARVDPPQGSSGVLGGTEDLSPQGPVPAYTRFEWDLECPVDGSFTLEIFAADDLVEPLVVVDQLQQNQWTYAEDEAEALPSRIVWQVFAMQAGIPTGARVRGEAWIEAGD